MLCVVKISETDNFFKYMNISEIRLELAEDLSVVCSRLASQMVRGQSRGEGEDVGRA